MQLPLVIAHGFKYAGVGEVEKLPARSHGHFNKADTPISLIAAQTPLMPDSTGYSARQQGLPKALDYMRGDFETQFSMAEICQVFWVTLRTDHRTVVSGAQHFEVLL
jgi:hypothetical protein